jgi:hypothetical protein
MELDFNADLNVNWSAIFQSWLETPLLDRLNRFGVETESKTASHAYIPRVPSRINDQPQNTSSLLLGSARLFGVVGIRSGDCGGCGDSASDFVHSSAEASTATRSNAQSMTDANTTTRAGANAPLSQSHSMAEQQA